MDLITSIGTYGAAAVAIATIVIRLLPAPTATSGVYPAIYNLVSVIANLKLPSTDTKAP
jgi:hypothetical protein